MPHGDLASRALSKAGYVFSSEEVLFIELKNRPGALAKAVEKLARARISIRARVCDRLVADEDDRRSGCGLRWRSAARAEDVSVVDSMRTDA